MKETIIFFIFYFLFARRGEEERRRGETQSSKMENKIDYLKERV